MKLRYEGNHDAVTLDDADGNYVMVERGGEADVADADVEARLAGGWVHVGKVRKATKQDDAAATAAAEASSEGE